MTLDATKVKAFTTGMGIDDALVDAFLEVAAAQIEQYVGAITVSKWTTVPAMANFAAAKLIKMWTEENSRETGVSSETRSSFSQTYQKGASGLPQEIETLLKPLQRLEAIRI